MSDAVGRHLRNGAERALPHKNETAELKADFKAGEAKSGPAPAAKASPKKPAKKAVKSWPAANALITIASLTATLGGWAHFTVQEVRLAEAEAAQWAARQPAIVESVADTTVLNLPPIPTVVPPPDNADLPATQAAVTVPTAPALRSVSAPPPAVRAPAPVASTRSSRR